MKRSKSKKVEERNSFLLSRIKEVKAEHPAWGYRRVWAYIRYHDEIKVGKNRIYRLLKENNLLAINVRKLRAKRTKMPSKPRTKEPNKIWGIDMTKIKVQSWGWVYLVVVKDWGSKKIVGWSLSPQSKTDDWLKALSNAINKQFPEGIGECSHSLKLVSDNGCQPTSLKFMKSCNALNIKQIFTSFNNPKGNADTERVFRTMKEDLIWLNEWISFEQLKSSLKTWIDQYNNDFPHSSLGYIPPNLYELNHLKPKKSSQNIKTNINQITILLYP